MPTQVISDRPLLAGRPQDVSLDTTTLVRADRARILSRLLLFVSALMGSLGVFFAAWHFGEWPGLAVAAGLLALAVAVWCGTVLADMYRTHCEFERLVASLGQIEPISVSSFRLGHGWDCLAQQLVDVHGSWARQLRERCTGTQKLELAQRLAEAAQRRAEAVVNSLCDAVLVTNPFGELVLANAEAERLFGFALGEVRGKPAGDVLSDSTLLSLISKSAQCNAGPRRHTVELSLPANGKARWYKATTSQLADYGTEQPASVTVLRDVTSDKAAHARSSDFVSAVSHEIKTPLASVKAYAELLADGDATNDAETQQRFLGIIESQTDRMTRMLDGMLDLARIESGIVHVDRKPVSLNELIESGARLMQPAAADKNITIETRFSSLYLAVEVDVDMMSRVMMNLISNAIKYTDPGGRVILRSQMVQDLALFEVEDTGRGIPADAMGKLFQKFYRVQANAGMAHGTGLGLSLVKHIVEELHGGKVTVESQVGNGSIFRVELPLYGLQRVASVA